MVDKLHHLVGDFSNKTICLLGLSFKPDTDDIREAPALEMVASLIEAGATVKAYDPAAMEHSKQEHPDLICCEDPYTAAQDADLDDPGHLMHQTSLMDQMSDQT